MKTVLKLTLNKETLRSLEPMDAQRVEAGMSFFTHTLTDNCRGCNTNERFCN